MIFCIFFPLRYSILLGYIIQPIDIIETGYWQNVHYG
jgi:hypothetical protein